MDTLTLALATTFAPFAAFAVALLFLGGQPRAAQALVLAGGAVSLAGALALLLAGPVEPLRFLWFASGQVELRFGFFLDGLSLMFGAAVALVTLCVMVYSVGYMGGDPGRTRYFALLGLFEWSMLSFVYAVDLLQSFIFWELVGLSSFFLIGFWYEKPEARDAATKAFVMTRIGDVGLFIGLLMILHVAGGFDIPGLLDPQSGMVRTAAPFLLTIISLLIFAGIAGKSAQLPLHTWLPDAMEGPTPVSALLHSATMVAAGVFLMARLHPLFMAADYAPALILAVSALTALAAATMAMVESDIKRVLAYSSISQLGFMLMGLAAGSLFAGVFHLVTHAFFKALLFLCSGLFIHHCGTNDMEGIGRAGGRRLRFAAVGLAAGGAALAGVPPLAGFFSKEEIFASLGQGAGGLVTGAAFLAALLTAYYTFRMIFLVTRPERIEEAGGDSHHEGRAEPWVMALPVAVLTLGSVIAGFWGREIAAGLGVAPAPHSLASMAPALAVVALGVLWAWLDFGRAGARRTGSIRRAPALETLFVRQWYVDALYRAVVVRLTLLAARVLHAFEVRGLDLNFERFGFGILGAGTGSTRLQTGWVQFYGGWAVVLVGLAAAYVGLR